MITRRNFLHSLAGAAAAAGMPSSALAMSRMPRLAPLLVPGAGGAAARAERALILVWLDGGASHLDTFDGKPQATPEVRGELRTIATAVDGVHFSEHLPRLAAHMPHCTLLRSVTHGEGNHDRGSHYLLTGHRPSPVLVHPALGAVRGADDGGALPAFVSIPHAPDYGREGFLAATRAPFEVGGDPGTPDFTVRHLAARPGLERARALLGRIDALDGAPRSAAEAARDRALQQALAMGAGARETFDLGREPERVRARYGRHRLGQACLLARRLVQGGVRTVLVRDQQWDHHQGIARALTYGFPPKLEALDQAVGALIEDLEQSGLREQVLVCVASEFGRTPRLNPAGGRDHWPRAQSVLLYGAGVRRGVVVGTTDARGEEPDERPVSPGDVFATLVAALGGDVDALLRTPDGRPVRVVEEGAAPIHEALA